MISTESWFCDKNLEYGVQSIDVSTVSTGVLVLQFTSAEGIVSTKKIIKK